MPDPSTQAAAASRRDPLRVPVPHVLGTQGTRREPIRRQAECEDGLRCWSEFPSV